MNNSEYVIKSVKAITGLTVELIDNRWWWSGFEIETTATGEPSSLAEAGSLWAEIMIWLWYEYAMVGFTMNNSEYVIKSVKAITGLTVEFIDNRWWWRGLEIETATGEPSSLAEAGALWAEIIAWLLEYGAYHPPKPFMETAFWERGRGWK